MSSVHFFWGFLHIGRWWAVSVCANEKSVWTPAVHTSRKLGSGKTRNNKKYERGIHTVCTVWTRLDYFRSFITVSIYQISTFRTAIICTWTHKVSFVVRSNNVDGISLPFVTNPMAKIVTFFMPILIFLWLLWVTNCSWRFVSILFLLVSTFSIAAQTCFVYAAIVLRLRRNGAAFAP